MKAEHIWMSQWRMTSWWQSLRGNVDDWIGIYNDTLHLYTWYGEPGTRITPPMRLQHFSFKKVATHSPQGSFQVVHGGHRLTLQGISVGTAELILLSSVRTETPRVISLRPKHMVFMTKCGGRFYWKFQYMDLPETVLQEVRPVCCGW